MAGSLVPGACLKVCGSWSHFGVPLDRSCQMSLKNQPVAEGGTFASPRRLGRCIRGSARSARLRSPENNSRTSIGFLMTFHPNIDWFFNDIASRFERSLVCGVIKKPIGLGAHVIKKPIGFPVTRFLDVWVAALVPPRGRSTGGIWRHGLGAAFFPHWLVF